MTEMIGGSKKTAILAAFLTILNLNFLAWGKLGEASSLGIFFFIFFLYLVLRFLSFPVNKLFFLFLILTWIAIGVTHFLPAVVSVLILILAIAIKIHYQTTAKHRFARWISLLIPLAFLVSLLIVPAATVFRGILLPMLGTSSFSVDKLFSTSIWELVFGISAGSPVKDAILYQIFPLLGLIGAIYVLQKQKMFKRDVSLLLLLGFVATLVNYRILKYTIVGGIFGPGRLRVFRDTLALPFVAVALSTGIGALIGTESKLRGSYRWKSLLAGFLIAICLSAWTTAAVYETYEYYTQGLMPTSIEVEAINFISEHADGGYVVFAPHRTAVISWGFIGIPHPEISYLSMGRIGVPADPTVMDMFSYMRDKGVDEGYLILTAFGTVDLQKINAASRDFGLLKVISDGNGHEVYVFNYKIPPLPTGPELMAFYWDTPPSYYLQSDLMRIKINPAAQTIDVTDFFGGLYEGIEFSGTLVGGHSVGNLTSIEYFNASSNEWSIWTPETEFPSLSLFEFRLRFESQTLLGVFERGDPPLRLWWESGQAAKWSLRTGDYSRLYIPGLIGSLGSFDVNSREHGFLYTRNLTENIIMYPASRPELNNTALTYNDIKRNCNFNLTDSRLSYEFHVENTADADQWAYVEVRLPDQVYTGTFPPLYYSIDDGETWTYAPYNVELEGSVPIVTYGGAETNWFFTIPRSSKDPPTKWWSFERALGDSPTIPDQYTDSGGAQNKMIYGFYLPAKDKILVRLGVSVYYARPLETTYVFDDSANIYYGLRNMEQGLVKLYNPGSSESVVGLLLSRFPTGLSITQNEDDKITSIRVSLPAETILALLSETDVNTELDSDTDGIPDQIP